MGYAVVAAVALLTLLGLARLADIIRRHRDRQDRLERGLDDPAPSDPPPERRARTRRQAWFSVRGGDAVAVARSLGLRTVRDAKWSEAAAIGREGLFAVAVAGERVLLVGADAFARGELGRVEAALRQMSKAHGEAAWFCFDVEADVAGFGLARRGEIERAFCFDGRDDEVLWEIGEPTADELALGFFQPDPRDGSDDPIKWWPLPQDVRALSRRWTSDLEAAPVAPDGGILAGRW